MQAHPLAAIFPPMAEGQFEALKKDIAEHGQIDPICILDGKILDGRNRWRACEELGIKPKTQDFNGNGDPLRFIIAKNLHRRHLSESARALIAGRLPGLKWGRPRKDEKEELIPLNELSDLFSISSKSIQHAKSVIENGDPEIIRAVEQEKITVTAAKELVKLEPAEQITIARADDRERKQLIKEGKQRAKAIKKKKKSSKKEFTLEAETQKLGKNKKTHFSVAEWNALSKTEREEIIAKGFDASGSLNKQGSTRIEWAQWSLNTVTGCKHDCPYCYARDIINQKFKYGFEPLFHPDRLSGPAATKIPQEAVKQMGFRNIFANSMSDLFGQWVPDDWIESTIEMARRNSKWNFLTLTKFPIKAAEFDYPDNWWMGTTVDTQARVENAERAFAKIRCKTKWLSCEPLLTPLKFKRIDLFQWIVIGGSSPSTKTPEWIPPFDWVTELHRQARDAGLKIYHRTNLGLYDSMRVREFPWAKAVEKTLPKSFRYLKGM